MQGRKGVHVHATHTGQPAREDARGAQGWRAHTQGCAHTRRNARAHARLPRASEPAEGLARVRVQARAAGGGRARGPHAHTCPQGRAWSACRTPCRGTAAHPPAPAHRAASRVTRDRGRQLPGGRDRRAECRGEGARTPFLFWTRRARHVGSGASRAPPVVVSAPHPAPFGVVTSAMIMALMMRDAGARDAGCAHPGL